MSGVSAGAAGNEMAEPSNEGLVAELARLNKILRVLMDRAERLEFHRLCRTPDVRSACRHAGRDGPRRYRAFPSRKDRAVIEIVETGPLNTVQDLGRPGWHDPAS